MKMKQKTQLRSGMLMAGKEAAIFELQSNPPVKIRVIITKSIKGRGPVLEVAALNGNLNILPLTPNTIIIDSQ